VSTPDPDRAHFEVRIAAHPSDPDVLLAAGMAQAEGADRYGVLVYRSADGGATWSRSHEVERAGTVNDPDLAFGPDGRAYLVEMGSGEQLLHRSPDGGRTWSEPTSISVGDRPFLAVSGGDTPHPGRVFVHGADRTTPLAGGRGKSSVSVVRADDGGARLLPGETLHVTGARYVLGTGESVVLSDGTLVLLYPERRDRSEIGRYEGVTDRDPRNRREANARLRALISSDGGETFGPARTVASWHHRFGRGRSATVPALAADTSGGPFGDRLYAAWTDFRSGEGQVLLSRSNDRGRSWSDPIVVNRDGGPAFHPMLAVNGDGVVGVAWYDRRASESGLGYAVRFAASVDGGETVGPSVRISDEPFRYTWEAGLVTLGRGGGDGERHRANVSLYAFNEIGGHTAGMAVDASGRFHPLWVDNRTGVSQMWTAPVDVEAEAARHGDPALAGLRDLTGKTALRVEQTGYDDGPRSIEITVRLRNTAEDTVVVPVHLRLLDAWSELGTPRLANGPHEGSGPGTAIPLDGSIPEGGLSPGQASQPIELRVRLASPEELGPKAPPPAGRSPGPGYGLVNLDLEVLGRVRGEVER